MLESNSVPQCPANPQGFLDEAQFIFLRFAFCLFDFFLSLLISKYQGHPPSLHKPQPPLCPGMNRLSFLLLKTGFPGVDRPSWKGGWLF